jgi:hypothetical protein
MALCFLPAVPHLLEIANRRSNWAMFVPQSPPSGILQILPLYAYQPLLPILVWAGAILALRYWRGSPGVSVESPNAASRYFVLTACWLLVPLGIAWLATERDWARLFFLRYVIVTALAPIMFSALCCAFCPGRTARIVCASALVVLALHNGGMINQYRRDGRVIGDRNQDWRSAVRALNDKASNLEIPMFVRSGLIEADELHDSSDRRLREYCLLPVLGVYPIQRDPQSLTPLPTTTAGILSDEDRRRIATAGEAWFLLSGTPGQVRGIVPQLCRRWEAYRVRANAIVFLEV